MTNALDPARFVTALAPAVRRAAALARELEGRVANRPKHGERSPVKAALTAADTKVQEILLQALVEVSPELRLEAEEDTPSVRVFTGSEDACVVLDPIDGTLRFFLEGLGPYSLLMGLAHDDVYVAAHVALPREQVFVDAVRGQGARLELRGRPAAPARAERDGHRVLISHDLSGTAVESLLAAGFEVAPASGGAISVAPLLPGVCGGLRLMPGGPVSTRGRIGALAAREAGALVCTSTGEPFPHVMRSDHATMLVAADESVLQALRAAATLAEAR